MRQVFIVLIAVSTLGLGACSTGSDPDEDGNAPPGEFLCTLDIRPGFVFEVRDAVTGAPAAAGAVGTIRDGAYEEILHHEGGVLVPPPDALRLVGAHERRGTYDLRVEKPGYEVWTRTGIIVTRDECHVQTVYVRTDLEPIL